MCWRAGEVFVATLCGFPTKRLIVCRAWSRKRPMHLIWSFPAHYAFLDCFTVNYALARLCEKFRR